MRSYPLLFSPLALKNTIIPNRIFMPPMGSNLAGVDGSVSVLNEKYYALRAQGGVGLITVENVCIDYPLGTNGTTQLRFDNDQYLPGFYRLVESMHAFGACVSVQINHAGSSAWPGRLGGEQAVSASAIPTKSGALTRPLTVEEIHGIVAKYGEGALRAKRAGCDCVEIHAGHMYLVSQFLSPLTNHRNDEFGGSKKNRARLAAMVAQEVRKSVGPQFPIIMRVSADEMLPGGNTLDDTLEMLEYMLDEVDMISVSAALPDSIEFQIDKMSLADGWRAYMARAVREKFHKPVVASGNIRNPEIAERLLAEGFADMIAIGRGLIADPFWPEKARNGQEKLIRRCISCNIGCADNRIASARPLRCSVNPDILHAEPVAVTIPEHPLNVVVVGGGVAGLEAACTAAEEGCHVYLLEKGGKVGGLARRIADFPAKYRIGNAVDYLEARAANLPNLRIQTGITATMNTVTALHPDMVIMAAGSTPFLPPITGLAEALGGPTQKMFTIFGLMREMKRFEALPPSNIVVVGGGAVGLDVVEFFAEMQGKGHRIHIVEMLPALGRDLDMITGIAMRKMLKEHNISCHVNTRLERVTENSLEFSGPEGPLSLPYDYAFMCLGLRGVNPMPPEFECWCEANDVEVISVGDTRMARRIIDAVREGRAVKNKVRTLYARRDRCHATSK